MSNLLDMPRLSLEERDRRWARVRQIMAERDWACIITPPHSGHWELFQADTRYLTHIGGNCSETACVFPLQGEVTAIVLNRPEFWAQAQNWVVDLRTPRHHMWSTPIIERMKELGVTKQRVGVVGLGGGVRTPEGTIAHGIYERIRQAFPNVIFEDATVVMADLRAVKSPEEIACMERATEMIEGAIEDMAAAAKPGVPDYKVYAAIHASLVNAGSEVPTMVLWGSGPGHPHDAFLPTRRPLERGDMLSNEIEARYLGYQAQRVQPAILGEPLQPMVELMDKHRIVFDTALDQLRPGTRFGDIARLIDKVSEEVGCTPRLTMHGRGLGEDRPLLVGGDMTPETESFILQEGNAFIMKPTLRAPDGTSVVWGDTVVVTPQGGRRLGKDKHEILAIPV